MLGCSTRKLRELLHAAGLARPAPDIARIEEVVQSSMLDMNAGVGVRRIVGHLTTQRVPFTWAAVAEIMRTIDPVGRDLRFRRAIPRVHYNVHEALGMWHFDGYEHLVAWNICAHKNAATATLRGTYSRGALPLPPSRLAQIFTESLTAARALLCPPMQRTTRTRTPWPAS